MTSCRTYITISILGFFAITALLPDLRLSLPALVFVTAMITVLLVMAVHRDVDLSPGLILSVAAVIRLMMVFRAPELSDDIYRYLWDGLQTVSGHNPYLLAPAQVVPASPSDLNLIPLVNHPDLVTVYPPGAQVVFFISALFRHQAIVLKSLLALMDLGTCALIIRFLKTQGLPVTRSVLYAWHPLAVIEIAGSGHIDAAGIFFLLLSLSLIHGRRKYQARPMSAILSGGFFAWACLVKLFPVVAAPLFFFSLRGKQRTLFLAGALSGGMLLCLPFLPHLAHMLDTLSTFTRHWEFSGFSYFWLRHWGFSGDLSRIILGSAFALAVCIIFFRSAQTSGDLIESVFRPFYQINLYFLFLTPTLHPWYALYLVAMLPFVPGVTGVVLSWSVFLAYSVQIPYTLTGQWIEYPLFTNLIWVGPQLALLASRYRYLRGHYPYF